MKAKSVEEGISLFMDVIVATMETKLSHQKKAVQPVVL